VQFHTTIGHGHHLSYSSISQGSSEGSLTAGPGFHFHFFYFLFSPRRSGCLFPFLDLYLKPTALLSCTHPSHSAAALPSSCCMEQRRMHSQQLTQNASDPASFDILHTPFYPSYSSEPVNSKVTQAPRHSPPYVQRQFAPDSGASLEGGGSPPLPAASTSSPTKVTPASPRMSFGCLWHILYNYNMKT
jgi:hypothetical protein